MKRTVQRNSLTPMTLLRTTAVALALCFAASAASAQGGPMAACKDDVAKLCPGVQPGQGRIAACLKEHPDQVSQTCKSAIEQAMALRQQSGGGSTTANPNTPHY